MERSTGHCTPCLSNADCHSVRDGSKATRPKRISNHRLQSCWTQHCRAPAANLSSCRTRCAMLVWCCKQTCLAASGRSLQLPSTNSCCIVMMPNRTTSLP
jgi:hypothetical protein